MRSFLILIDRVMTRCGAVLLFVAASLCLQCTAGATAPLGPPPPKPKEVADHSLSIEAYAKLGIPALDLKWTEEDGAKAVSILVKLAKDDISKLPRYGSKFSGPVFEKLCQTEMRSVGSLLGLYDDRTWQFDNECAEIRLAWFRRRFG